jgi:hypothetical protein
MAVNPDRISRYEHPMEISEISARKGMCYNCAHRCPITLASTLYDICAQERDDDDSTFPHGEIYECDPEQSDCGDWSWDGYGL